MRHGLVATVGGLLLLTGCATGAGMQNDFHQLREAQARLAMSKARAQCVVATNRPPGNKIVETCARGMAPNIYQEIVAGDNAQLEMDLPPSVQPAPSTLPLVSPQPPIAPQIPQTTAPLDLYSPSARSGCSNVGSVAMDCDGSPGYRLGNQTWVHAPGGGLEPYNPSAAPVPYTGFPSVQPSFGSE